ncbi:DUF4288 domain-containing protein [Actinomadura montaniterrae]|uniref:DUF4288 domain-containing protein n=1 Tax=Actinomadura montaniterrae TaxID=1803903 RepID=UPI001CEF8BD9|nr:DUF4288 domain-containing protein [Actinomadura montaniterrae]
MSELPEGQQVPAWFGVRCFFKVAANSYEERITIWRADSHDDAIALAEADAHEYAETLDGVAYLDLAQSYLIGDAPEQGSEVFSLIRDSDLDEDEYLDTFFNTGTERQM